MMSALQYDDTTGGSVRCRTSYRPSGVMARRGTRHMTATSHPLGHGRRLHPDTRGHRVIAHPVRPRRQPWAGAGRSSRAFSTTCRTPRPSSRTRADTQLVGSSRTPSDVFVSRIVFATLGFLSLLGYALVFAAARRALTRPTDLLTGARASSLALNPAATTESSGFSDRASPPLASTRRGAPRRR